MRTYITNLVQITFVIGSAVPALAQNVGVSEPPAQTRGTVLEMPATAAQRNTPAPATPARGMRMSRVRSEFGAPQSQRGPVGQPPITRWDYADYRVFFEYDHVVHTVVPDRLEPLAHENQLQPVYE